LTSQRSLVQIQYRPPFDSLRSLMVCHQFHKPKPDVGMKGIFRKQVGHPRRIPGKAFFTLCSCIEK
jgi:hypothetical protein